MTGAQVQGVSSRRDFRHQPSSAMEYGLAPLPPLTLPSLDHYLRSNRLPGPFERVQLQRLLLRAAEVHNELEIRQAELKSYTKSLEIALAPCRILSSDIWMMIFGLIPERCWELSWVCRTWRVIVLSARSLWAVLPAMGQAVGSAKNFFRCIETQRRRAGSHPLVLSKLHLPPAFGFQHDDLHKFVVLFQDLIPSIKSIDIVVSRRGSIKDLQFLMLPTFPPKTFDSLTSVNITLDTKTEDELPENPLVLFLCSPKLRHFNFSLPTLTSCKPIDQWLDISWTNVTTLNMGWILVSDVYQLLKEAPCLEEFTARVNVQSPSDQRPSKMFKHSRLRTFSLLFNDHSRLNIPLLNLPMARRISIDTELQLKSLEKRLPKNPNPVRPIKRSSHSLAQLTHLFIGHPSFEWYDAKQMVTILQFTPFLAELWTTWMKNMHQFFAALYTSTTELSGVLLPSLAVFRICKVPLSVLMTGHEKLWPITIDQLARRRGAASQLRVAGRRRVLSLPPMDITMTFENTEKARRFFFASYGDQSQPNIVKVLNTASVMARSECFDSIDLNVDEWPKGLDDEYTSQGTRFLLNYIQNFKPPRPDRTDDLVSCPLAFFSNPTDDILSCNRRTRRGDSNGNRSSGSGFGNS